LETILPTISEWAAGTLNGSILDTVFFPEMEFYKNNTKFQRKRGGHCPLGPPLNLPMHAFQLQGPVVRSLFSAIKPEVKF